MMVTEKGLSFRMDAILGITPNNKQVTQVGRHTLPVKVPCSKSSSKAIAVKRCTAVNSNSFRAESPPTDSINFVPIVESATRSILNDCANPPVCLTEPSRKRRISEDDSSSVCSLDSGRSSPDDFSAASDIGIDSVSKKKGRTSFAVEQINALEDLYLQKKYISPSEREAIATSLCLSDLQVKTWFQNRRMKERRTRGKDTPPAFPTGGVDVSQLQALGLPCPPLPTKKRRKSTSKTESETNSLEKNFSDNLNIPASVPQYYSNVTMPYQSYYNQMTAMYRQQYAQYGHFHTPYPYYNYGQFYS